MQLNTVVFPAPFGPISELIDPASTFRLSPSTAVRPPNAWVISRTSRRAAIKPSPVVSQRSFFPPDLSRRPLPPDHSRGIGPMSARRYHPTTVGGNQTIWRDCALVRHRRFTLGGPDHHRLTPRSAPAAGQQSLRAENHQTNQYD